MKLSPQALEELLGQSLDMLTVLNEAGLILYKSPASGDHLGYEPEELVGDVVFEYVHPDDREAALAAFEDVVEESERGATSSVEVRFQHADGSWVWLESRMRNSMATSIDGHVISSRDITDRKARRQTLERLHEATRELMAATTSEEVATITSETASQVLDLPLNAIHEYDPDTGEFVPLAWSDQTEETFGGPPPTVPAEESLAGRAYSNGTPEMYPDVREADRVLNPETPLRSEMHLPLGDHGVLVAGSTSVDDFDAPDETLAQVFAANVEAALDRVDREQALNSRNERLEEFASIVSHDLRNPLNVIGGHLRAAQEEGDSDHLAVIGEAHERMETLVDDLLTLARQGDDVAEMVPVPLGRLVEACWDNVETGDAQLRVETDVTVRADETRLKQLLENLERNAVEHGGDDVTVTVGDLTDGCGFYVEDDGSGIPETERERVFERGFTTGQGGTGVGLAIVEQVVGAHGWTVTVTEGAAGGVRFEFRGLTVES